MYGFRGIYKIMLFLYSYICFFKLILITFILKEKFESKQSSSSLSSEENDGNKERGLIGDIEKLKKLGQILTTVGEKVIPALVVESSAQIKSSEEDIAVKSKTKALHLLQILKKDVDGIAKK